MKKLSTLALLLFVTLSLAFAQTREEKKVGSFTKISFRTPGKFYLRQGSPQKVEIEGDAKALEEIEVRVDGDKLIVGKEGWNSWSFDWKDSDKINVYVTVPDIEGIAVAGSGDLIVEGKIKVSDLDLNVSGSGTLKVEAEASGDVDADVSGSGAIDLKGSCRAFDSHVSGSGKVRVEETIAQTANFGVSGSGKILASGTVKEVKASISGSGEVLAANLIADSCDVRISGSGDVEINVKSDLDAHISGSGSVTYKGNPAHVNSHSSGSGKVRKM